MQLDFMRRKALRFSVLRADYGPGRTQRESDRQPLRATACQCVEIVESCDKRICAMRTAPFTFRKCVNIFCISLHFLRAVAVAVTINPRKLIQPRHITRTAQPCQHAERGLAGLETFLDGVGQRNGCGHDEAPDVMSCSGMGWDVAASVNPQALFCHRHGLHDSQ